jgi:excisionase family DNA binding protein
MSVAYRAIKIKVETGTSEVEMAELRSEVLTAQQVARLLGVHPAVVYRRAKKRRLGHIRVGEAVRFPKADVEAFLRRVYQPAQTENGAAE